ncbi:MotA/TolQ/ExbB proton channel family protein [Phycisphaerales bacterium AB-hyl4]|uniref:MotA/TolQ/ExbB proton channel family protein n=1 Tax=Natronomicrosphaera hydrolytica TaxID=3242702 RepID=A0ABV4U8T0_9BACT
MHCTECHHSLADTHASRCSACGRPFSADDPTTYLPTERTMHWLHVPVGLTIIVALVVGLVLLAGDARPFLNPIAMLWVIGVLLGGLWLSFGPRAILNAMAVAITLPREIDRDSCVAHLLVFARAYQLAWAGGLIGLLWGLITIFANLDDPSIIGPGLSVTMSPVLYGALLAELVFAPIQQAIASRSGQSALHFSTLVVPHRSMQGLALAVVFAILATCLMFMLAHLG